MLRKLRYQNRNGIVRASQSASQLVSWLRNRSLPFDATFAEQPATWEGDNHWNSQAENLFGSRLGTFVARGLRGERVKLT